MKRKKEEKIRKTAIRKLSHVLKVIVSNAMLKMPQSVRQVQVILYQFKIKPETHQKEG